ncbi:unnamed protein product [Toxocara canis]|uniref:glucuronosyltransferase n=1 Tax=Toxocara canis TaxID=6265 RepID=A0A183VA41_TOXCA|nr:unnamed protein product [Toxocara canis]
MKLFLTFLAFILPVECLKILIYQVAVGRSHMSFSGALTDILADAGHEVHLLISEWNPSAKDDCTKRATSIRRIRMPPNGTTISHLAHLADPFKMTVWKYFSSMEQFKIMKDVPSLFCKMIINDDELMKWLREQHFDAALTSMYDLCPFGLFHVTGIKPVIGYVATPIISNVIAALKIDSPASYTPGNRATILFSTSITLIR